MINSSKGKPNEDNLDCVLVDGVDIDVQRKDFISEFESEAQSLRKLRIKKEQDKIEMEFDN